MRLILRIGAIGAAAVALFFLWVFPASGCGIPEAEANFRASVPLHVCAAWKRPDAMAWMGFIMLSGSEDDPPYGHGLYLDHLSPEEMQARAKSLLTRAAVAGDGPAQNELGLIYLEGRYGHETDFAQARIWLERSLTSGDYLAPFNLARMSAEGAGVTPSLDRVTEYLGLSAEMGYEVAECVLDDLGKTGPASGDKVDIKRAAQLFEADYSDDCKTNPPQPGIIRDLDQRLSRRN